MVAWLNARMRTGRKFDVSHAGSPVDRLGLINLNGTVVAPRPNWGWRARPNAGGEGRR